jgi:hypothetical protein
VFLGWLIQSYGPTLGLDPKWAFGIAWLVALAVAVGANFLLKPKPKRQSSETQAQIPPATPININIENKPVFENKVDQRVIDYQSQAQSQSNIVTQSTSASPEIECVDCYFTQETLSAHWNRLGQSTGKPCRAALAEFYLKPIPGADPWIELRTQLVFYGANDDTRLQRVRDGVWMEQGNVIQMPMQTGDTRRLVIALEFEDGFTTYEYAEQRSDRPRITTTGIYHHFLVPALSPLSENDLKVRVGVTGKYMDKVTFNGDFWFSLTRPDMIIKQIPPPEGHRV